ncbi:SulP family inorganic anion transporter [Brevibacillus sp. H7]|uniref:SulP family inorganic anion transporter n=1 Tax=Brevibacillus sp. H7 TaxID=3349138 RepID=UPI00382CC3D4
MKRDNSQSRFRDYSWGHLRKDLISGFIVGIIAIPLGMAFAIASGVKPEYGIYTTIVAGILISMFGGSRYQIGGPTGAFVPILLSIVMTYGYENLLIAGLMAGVMLLLMGIFRLGSLIRYIPRPVTVGFTAGIAVIIFTGQLGNFLGLENLPKHESFLANMKEIAINLPLFNPYSVITAFICFAVLLLFTRFFPRIPGSLVGLLLSSLAASYLFSGQVATIGSTFGSIPSSLPELHIPAITWEKIVLLWKPALIIAALGGIESLLSAVVADKMTGTKHNSNRELIGQGIANIVTPFFGGIPATGAIARTATNIKNGGTSPVSGIVHGLVVLLTLLLFAPYASLIPLAAMAPILMFVAWNMSERKEFVHILKTRSTDTILLLVTFFLTVFVNLTVAVEVGLLLAVLLFTKKMSEIHVEKALPDLSDAHKRVVPHVVSENHDCPQIAIYNLEGALFFGATGMLEKAIAEASLKEPRIVLLRMGKVPYIDTTGESILSSFFNRLQKKQGKILISGLRDQPRKLLTRSGLLQEIGQENLFEHTAEAIDSALTKLDPCLCIGCKHNAFQECSRLSQKQHADATIPS